MRLAELITAVILAVFSVYLMWKSGQPAWQGEPWFANIWFVPGEGPGSGFWPFWLSGIMLLCTFWIMWNWYKRKSPPSRSEEPFLDEYGRIILLKVGGGLLGFIALVDILGMYGAMTCFLLYYLLYIGKHRLRLSLLISIGAPIVTFFFFDVAMRIVLPKGYLEPLFIPLYDIFL